jgi:hypothetical protein
MVVGCRAAAAALLLVLPVGLTVGLAAMLEGLGLGVRLTGVDEGDGAPTEMGLGIP